MTHFIIDRFIYKSTTPLRAAKRHRANERVDIFSSFSFSIQTNVNKIYMAVNMTKCFRYLRFRMRANYFQIGNESLRDSANQSDQIKSSSWFVGPINFKIFMAPFNLRVRHGHKHRCAHDVEWNSLFMHIAGINDPCAPLFLYSREWFNCVNHKMCVRWMHRGREPRVAWTRSPKNRISRIIYVKIRLIQLNVVLIESNVLH